METPELVLRPLAAGREALRAAALAPVEPLLRDALADGLLPALALLVDGLSDDPGPLDEATIRALLPREEPPAFGILLAAATERARLGTSLSRLDPARRLAGGLALVLWATAPRLPAWAASWRDPWGRAYPDLRGRPADGLEAREWSLRAEATVARLAAGRRPGPDLRLAHALCDAASWLLLDLDGRAARP